MEQRKEKNTRKNKTRTLDSKGRTPPFRRLTCLCCEKMGVFDHLSHANCCSVTLSSIKDGLQQWSQGCDGSCVQAPCVERASWNVFSNCACVSVCVEAEGFLPRHLRGGCCHQRKDVQALVLRF